MRSRNRVKLIRYRRRPDSIPRKSRFQIAARERRRLPHSINASRFRERSGFHHLSPAFCPGWASVNGEAPAAGRAARAMSFTCDSIIGAKLRAADSVTSLSIRCGRERDGGYEPLAAAPTTAIGSQPELFENTE